ncbi:hypothetical protein DXG03_005770 [Asterophora parasitica]|uniref:Ras-domain-containing protein n=1 Tax=Asterophora parasitica TaxID=117018 RepID=A0A9P7KAU0_9AGAR|nr:hypothetical protein DXG03_005770 [Asterophora parasitica]
MDAALLMFDVTTPETMTALNKWWAEFRHCAPLADEDMEDYCCVVVGNKRDLAGRDGKDPVSEDEALKFLRELVPPTFRTPSPTDGDPPQPSTIDFPSSAPLAIISNGNASASTPSHSPKHHLSKSRSRSASRFYSAGTMSTTLSIYHTPSSSLFDIYQSARSSPEPWFSNSSSSLTPSRRTPRLSTGSASSGSAPTITPSLFAREHTAASSTTTQEADQELEPELDPYAFPVLPPPPARGPKLFFTSAKTGEGVSAVFAYIAQRVVRRWEYEERIEARRVHLRISDPGPDPRTRASIRLGVEVPERVRAKLDACCGS